jgi:membrane protein YqaA with SNARE-associated domain
MLAISAFTSATILPGTSEALLVSLALGPAAPYWMLLAVASAANVAGSVVNWLMGRAAAAGGTRIAGEGKAYRRAEAFWARWGKWSLLASWVPVVGDPLTIVAGLLRVPFWQFVGIVAVAKTARYAVVIAALALW